MARFREGVMRGHRAGSALGIALAVGCGSDPYFRKPLAVGGWFDADDQKPLQALFDRVGTQVPGLETTLSKAQQCGNPQWCPFEPDPDVWETMQGSSLE